MKKLLVVCALVAALSLSVVAVAGAAVVAGNTGWFWSNPMPQGNTLTQAETVSGRAYVAGEAGSIMRSDDGGVSWRGIRSGLPASRSAINVLRAVNADTVIFASACGLRRTDDGGTIVKRLPWGSSDIDCPNTIVSLSFPTPTIGYLLLDNGDVMQTQDGGDSWRRQTAAPGTAALGGAQRPSDIWFSSPTSGMVSVDNQIYYSTDSGSSWTPVQAIDGTGLVKFEFISSTVGFAVGVNASLYTTGNGGASWSAVAGDGTINTFNVRSLSCSDVNTCLAAVEGGSRILRTIDGGATWTVLTASSRPIFAVGFTSATRAVAVGADGASVSTDDAGANWASLNSEVLGSYSSIHADSSSSAVLYGVGTGLARTVDSGASWKAITTLASGAVRDATFPTAMRGYVLDSRNQLTRSDDGGITWKVLDLAGARPQSLLATSEQTLLLVGDKGIRRSSNAGLSFKTAGGSSFRKQKFSRADLAGKSIAAYGATAVVISSDDGKTWKKVSRLKKKMGTVKSVDFVDKKNGWLVDSNNELWATTKGGGKWTRLETTGLNKIVSMSRTDTKRGYLTDGSGSIFVTTDGGKSWSEEAPFLSNKRIATKIAPLSARGAILLVPGTNRILTTSTFGQIGVGSKLTIKVSSKTARKGSTMRVTGRLAGAQGGELVTVLARKTDALGGTRWVSQTATVSLGGTFTTTWRVDSPLNFVARWAGDATRDGDGANSVSVKLKKK